MPQPPVPADVELDPTLDFMRLLWSIEHGLQRASKRMEGSRGITGPQRLVLRIVRQHPGLTARALAESFGCAPSNQPSFVRVVTDPREILRIKDDTRVIGLFYSRNSAARDAFTDRRLMGGLVWLDDEVYEQVRDRVRLHRAAVEERRQRMPDAPAEPVIAPEDSVIAKPGSEIEKLVLSQRWV